MKMTRNEHVVGFKSCSIPIYWSIWMLSFLLNQIWIWIYDFLLNFFAIFCSVLALQFTVTMKVSQIHWDCLSCLFQCWALSLTTETGLLDCLSGHQTYRFGWSFIDPISFDSSWFYLSYTWITFSTFYHYLYV